MEALFVVLGLVGGLIAGFAITYFTFVSKLQKKLASAKKKLDRAQSANDDTESLQSQFDAQKAKLQGAESQLQAIEAAHQAQISDLEAQYTAALQELEALRQSDVSAGQILPDNSEELVAIQARLDEVEQFYQAELQGRLEKVEQFYEAELKTVEARHQAELEALRQSLTLAPPAIATEPESPESELASDPGNWGAAVIAGGAAAIGAGMAALSNFGQSSPPETEEPEVLPESFTEDFTTELESPELTEESLVVEELDHSPFDQPEILEEEGAFAEIPVAETEDLSPFATPEDSIEADNWVDVADTTWDSEEREAVETETSSFDAFGEPETVAAIEAESLSPFEAVPGPEVEVDVEVDTENWVDAPDDLGLNDLVSNEFDAGETPEDLLPDWSDAATPAAEAAELLDLDSWVSDGGDAGEFGAELPDMGTTSELDLGLELPDMTEEPAQDLGEFSFGDQGLGELTEDLPDGDELLAELTGTVTEDAGLDLFALEETTAAETLDDDLGLPSSPGDTLEMPDSFLADIPSFFPEPDAEDISEVGMGSDDDLDFLLQLQEDEPPSFPGEEFLPEFGDDEPLSSGFPTMELLTDDDSELSDLLGEARPTHEGDPFINILDETPHSSDNDLLALLRDEEGGEAHRQGDDDLFSGLEGMLNTDTPDNESDLDDLDALLSTSEVFGTDQGDVFSLEDLGLGDDDH